MLRVMLMDYFSLGVILSRKNNIHNKRTIEGTWIFNQYAAKAMEI